jgi:hypothetical protein
VLSGMRCIGAAALLRMRRDPTARVMPRNPHPRVGDYAAKWSGSTSTKPLVEIWAGQLLGSGLFKHQAVRIRLTD